FRPDDRGVAAYLASIAQPDDLIILTAEDPTMERFYWKGNFPAPSYNVLDPRLYRQKPGRSIFWVAAEKNVVPSIFSETQWTARRRFEGLVVLREDDTGEDMVRYVT